MAQKKITDLTLRSSFDETVNLPGDDTSQTWRVTGAQILAYIQAQFPRFDQSYEIDNLTISPSVGSSALTVAIKTKAGANASSTDPISVAMRSSTLTSGSYNLRTITGALSMVVSSGSTLGQIDTKAANIYVYLIDNAGTLEVAVSHALYPEDALVTTVAEGGAGAADSAFSMYSTTQRTSVPCRLIGYISNTQTTAGTWASAGTQVELMPKNTWKAPTVQKFTSSSGTYYPPVGCKRIEVEMVGGGGGGSGSSSSANDAGDGGDGGDTTFGTTLLSAGKGLKGTKGGTVGGLGGTASLGTGPIGSAINGSQGGGGSNAPGTAVYLPGGYGAPSRLSGGGVGGGYNNAIGSAVPANTGAGGSGAACPGLAGAYAGAGGGAGAYVNAMIGGTTANPLLGSYAYAVGSAGSAGSAGTSGGVGLAGSAGYIEVREFYN